MEQGLMHVFINELETKWKACGSTEYKVKIQSH